MSQSDKFPAGYYFRPNHEELILDYLMKKINNEPLPSTKIHTVQFYASTPDDLSQRFTASGDLWFFFTPRERKYENDPWADRVAGGGYWKPIPSEIHIMHNGERIGSRITLDYFEGKPQDSIKTDWLMQELRVMNSSTTQQNSMRLDDWVLCKVCKRSGNAGARMIAEVDGEVNDNFDRSDIDSSDATASPSSSSTSINQPSASTFEITGPSRSSSSTNLEQNTVGSSHLISTASSNVLRRSHPSYHQQVPSFASESHYGTADYHSQLQVQQGHDQLDEEYPSSSSSSCDDPSP